MTKQEFISRKQAYQNISGKGAVIAILLIFLFVFTVIGIWYPFSEFVQSHAQSEKIGNEISFAIKIIVILFVVGSFRLLILFFKIRMKKFGLTCLSCGKPLIGKYEVKVMSTGLCGYCGTKVFDDAIKEIAKLEFKTVSDFILRLKIYSKVLLRSSLIYLFIWSGTILGSIFLGRYFVTNARFEVLIIFVILFSIPMVALLAFYAIAMPDKRLRELDLICPNCKMPLIDEASRIVIKTGCCGYCNFQVVENLPQQKTN